MMTSPTTTEFAADLDALTFNAGVRFTPGPANTPPRPHDHLPS